MYNGLSPLLPTPVERDEPDGTTAWSDEVGLPGEKRLLAWTVVQEDTAVFDIHVLWDTPDLDVAMDAAFLHAQAFFGPNLTGGQRLRHAQQPPTTASASASATSAGSSSRSEALLMRSKTRAEVHIDGLWQPESSIGWIDVDRAEAQRVKELLGLFRAPEALDPHGILPLQITLSDRLFPGMSTQHTRARYIFFAGWHAERLASHRGKQSAANFLRQDEIQLMKSLLDGQDTTGIFGKRRREKTQTLPSGIYWSALQRWGIVPPGLPLWEVHQAAAVVRNASTRNQRSDDDAGTTHRQSGRLVLADFPPVPPSFPDAQDITLTSDEAEYLRDRIAASCKGAFLPTVLDDRLNDLGEVLADGALPWSINPDAGGQALVDARRFSELIHPARLMYTKLLVADAHERGRQLDDLSASLEHDFAEWRKEIESEIGPLRAWVATGWTHCSTIPRSASAEHGANSSRPQSNSQQQTRTGAGTIQDSMVWYAQSSGRSRGSTPDSSQEHHSSVGSNDRPRSHRIGSIIGGAMCSGSSATWREQRDPRTELSTPPAGLAQATARLPRGRGGRDDVHPLARCTADPACGVGCPRRAGPGRFG